MVASTSHSLWGCSVLSFQQWAHTVIHCGFNVARLPNFSSVLCLKKKKAVQGKPVGLNTEQYEPAGVPQSANKLSSLTKLSTLPFP